MNIHLDAIFKGLAIGIMLTLSMGFVQIGIRPPIPCREDVVIAQQCLINKRPPQECLAEIEVSRIARRGECNR